MVSKQELTDLTKRELEASKEVIDKLTRIIEHIMTKQTDEIFTESTSNLQKENTELKKQIVELKRIREDDLSFLKRTKDSLIHELQHKISQTVSEKESLLTETKLMINKLEKRCEQYEKKELCVKQYVTGIESKLLQANSTIKDLTQDVVSKQELINKQQKELETANIELRHYRFKDEVNQLLSDVATGLDSEIKSLMEEYGVETSGFSVKFVVEEEYEDE
tara:strand:+ start:295 stop:957 length:663 start_codon:yes stop_codon:yes gene_type:complete